MMAPVGSTLASTLTAALLALGLAQAQAGWADIPTDGTAPFWAPVNPSSGNKCSGPDATPVIVDYDANIDDVVALAYIAKEAKFDIKAVIVTGTAFANLMPGTVNTFKLLELLGLGHVDVGISPYDESYQWTSFPANCQYSRSIPLNSKGNSDIMYGLIQHYLPYSPKYPYTISTTDQTMTSTEVYEKHVEAGVTTVLTLGTMTALHKFQVDKPESFAKIEKLYAMFGAVDVPGNVFTFPNSPAEFNVIGDPHAGRAVLASPDIDSITLIPLDVTNQMPMEPDYMDALATLTTPEGRFVSELTHRVRNTWFCGVNCYYGFDENGVRTEQALADAYFFWDPLAAAIMADDSIAKVATEKIEVVASDPPNLDIDGWTRRNDTARDISYAYALADADTAANVIDHFIEVLARDCIEDQPLPLGALLELVYNGPTSVCPPCPCGEVDAAGRRLLFGTTKCPECKPCDVTARR